MKKLALSMMSLAMILFVATTVHSVTTNDPPPNNTTGITYVVSVDVSNANGLCHSYHVTISDRNGNLVASPKPYHDGIAYYVFHENGPITGPRVANLVEMETDNHPCTNEVYTRPDIIHTRFRNNETYFFTLYPSSVASEE